MVALHVLNKCTAVNEQNHKPKSTEEEGVSNNGNDGVNNSGNNGINTNENDGVNNGGNDGVNSSENDGVKITFDFKYVENRLNKSSTSHDK